MGLIESPIAIIGPLPPPLGGVSESVRRFLEVVRSTGRVVRHAAPKGVMSQAHLAITSLLSPNWALIANVSTANGLVAAAVTASVTRSLRRVVFIHGSILSQQLLNGTRLKQALIRRALGTFDEVWINNEDECAKWRSSITDLSLLVVSPFSSLKSGEEPDSSSTDRSFDLLCAEGLAEPETYGLDLVVEAWEFLRQANPHLSLVALLYGGSPEATASRKSALEARGVTTYADLDSDDVGVLLGKTATVIRPTSRDGDSLMVREALTNGCRVLTSGVVPRPLGCESVELTTEAIIDGIQNGGKPTDGAGLGVEPFEALFNRAFKA